MLDFDGDGFRKDMGSGYPVNATDDLRIVWELKLTREGGRDMDSAFLHFWRKSVLWQVQLEPVVHPLKGLGLASVGKGGVVDYINTTQVAYKRWREINERTQSTYVSRDPDRKER